MSQLKCQPVLEQVEVCLQQNNYILDKLHSVKRWSWADIFLDSGLISWKKRNQIKEINQALDQLEAELKVLNDKLKQSDLIVNNRFSNETYDFLFDVLMDNVFIDVSVHKKIKQIKEHLEALDEQLRLLKESLIEQQV